MLQCAWRSRTAKEIYSLKQSAEHSGWNVNGKYDSMLPVHSWGSMQAVATRESPIYWQNDLDSHLSESRSEIFLIAWATVRTAGALPSRTRGYETLFPNDGHHLTQTQNPQKTARSRVRHSHKESSRRFRFARQGRRVQHAVLDVVARRTSSLAALTAYDECVAVRVISTTPGCCNASLMRGDETLSPVCDMLTARGSNAPLVALGQCTLHRAKGLARPCPMSPTTRESVAGATQSQVPAAASGVTNGTMIGNHIGSDDEIKIVETRERTPRPRDRDSPEAVAAERNGDGAMIRLSAGFRADASKRRPTKEGTYVSVTNAPQKIRSQSILIQESTRKTSPQPYMRTTYARTSWRVHRSRLVKKIESFPLRTEKSKENTPNRPPGKKRISPRSEIHCKAKIPPKIGVPATSSPPIAMEKHAAAHPGSTPSGARKMRPARKKELEGRLRVAENEAADRNGCRGANTHAPRKRKIGGGAGGRCAPNQYAFQRTQASRTSAERVLCEKRQTWKMTRCKRRSARVDERRHSPLEQHRAHARALHTRPRRVALCPYGVASRPKNITARPRMQSSIPANATSTSGPNSQHAKETHPQ
ncbi:hypothetical protein PLICRDRAFT_25668 [Plicaturopsis crispa FD-325 SS-3]|nr:hypothetical protein PLICRDRAFT_25668 [Plicaturopsis crispa FD-325 SS-3]